MSSKLANLKIGPLKAINSRKPDAQVPSSIISAQQSIENRLLSSPQELQLIVKIPGSGPFLIADQIPDVIFLLQYEGANAFMETLPKDANGKILVENTAVNSEKSEVLLESFLNQTWEIFISELHSITGIQRQELQIRILNAGVQPLSVLFAQADPQNPTSLIFKHPSQTIHVETQKIEIDIIKNEPEISEREDIQCSCGSRRVRTVPVQIRRADEPPTIFAQCVSCKLRWAFSSA